MISLSSCDKAEKNETILLTAFNVEDDYGYDNHSCEYNSSNQLVKIINEYSSGENDHEMVIEFKYNEDGKVIEEIFTPDDGGVMKSIYTREGNIIRSDNYGQLEDGTWIKYESGEIMTLNDQGYPVETKYFWPMGRDSIAFNDSIVYSWENENMVEYKMYSINTPMRKHALLVDRLWYRNKLSLRGLKSSKTEVNLSYKFTYDDKLNPMALFGLDYGFALQCKNNEISRLNTSNGEESNEYTTVYEYNEDNYPDRAVVSENGAESSVITYKYKRK